MSASSRSLHRQPSRRCLQASVHALACRLFYTDTPAASRLARSARSHVRRSATAIGQTGCSPRSISCSPPGTTDRKRWTWRCRRTLPSLSGPGSHAAPSACSRLPIADAGNKSLTAGCRWQTSPPPASSGCLWWRCHRRTRLPSHSRTLPSDIEGSLKKGTGCQNKLPMRTSVLPSHRAVRRRALSSRGSMRTRPWWQTPLRTTSRLRR